MSTTNWEYQSIVLELEATIAKLKQRLSDRKTEVKALTNSCRRYKEQISSLGYQAARVRKDFNELQRKYDELK